MKIRRQKHPHLKKAGQYSKFRLWCEMHHIPVLLIPGTVAFIIGTVVFCIGGTLAGWDILGALLSKTALLIYTLIVAAAVIIATIVILSKQNR